MNTFLQQVAIFITFLFFINNGYGQSIGIYAGITHPYLTDYRTKALEGAGSFSSKGKWTSRAGLIASDKFFDGRYKLKIGIGIERMKTNFLMTSAPTPETYTTDILLEKDMMAITVYPINFNFWKNFEVNLGFEYSILLQEDISGIRYKTSDLSQVVDVTSEVADMNRNGLPGLRLNLSYAVYLGKHISLNPEYSAYFGLRPEFDKVQDEVKSFKNYFGLNAVCHFNRRREF